MVINLNIRGQDISQIISETNLDSLVQTVRVLSGEDSAYVNGVKILIKTRSNSSEGNNQAADYIKGRLLKYNLEVEDQIFNINGRNIIATQVGINNPNSIYIICAHYDAVTYYAADDNASGVSAVIEAARILSNQCFDYTILYVLWDQEEEGMVGSRYYSQLASLKGYKIAGVLNIDMLGYDSNNDMKFEIHTNNMPTSLAIKDELISNVYNYNLSLIPTIISPGIYSSDHYSFWNEGYGAVMLIELFAGGDRNPFYHSDRDRIGLFNLPYFKELSKLGIGTLATLARLIPHQPVLLTPANSSTYVTSTPNFIWNSVSGATSYRLQVSLNLAFTTSVIDQMNITSASYTLSTSLNNNTLYYWRVNATNTNGSSKWTNPWSFTTDNVTGIETIISDSSIILKQNYPNPFSYLTSIEFSIVKPCQVVIDINNILGEQIDLLFNRYLESGLYKIDWIAPPFLKGGIYYYHLRAGNTLKTKKMICSKY
jgi:hypothetical protein